MGSLKRLRLSRVPHDDSRRTCGFGRASQLQQIADGCFDFSHLGGAELAHAPGEFAVIETGESLHVHSGVFGQPAGFAKIDLASHGKWSRRLLPLIG